MTVKIRTDVRGDTEFLETPQSAQAYADLLWISRDKWYTVSSITITHNPEYPTPAISIVAPSPGIRFTVTDRDGNVLYTNYKPKETEK